MIETALYIAAGLLLGFTIGYLVRRFIAAKQLGSVEDKIKRSAEEAETRAKEIIIEAKEKSASLLLETKNE